MIRTIIRKTFEFTTFEEFFKRSLNVLYMANLTDVNPPLCDETHVSRSSAFVETPQALRDAVFWTPNGS